MKYEIKPVQMSKARDEAEKTLIRLLFQEDSPWRKPIFSFVKAEEFQNPHLKSVMTYLEKCDKDNKAISFNQVLNHFREKEEIVRLLSQLMREALPETVDHSQLGLDCVLHINGVEIQDKIHQLQSEIKAAEKNNQDSSPLTQEWLNLKKTYKNIREETIAEWKKTVEI